MSTMTVIVQTRNAKLTVSVDGQVWLLSTPVDCDFA